MTAVVTAIAPSRARQVTQQIGRARELGIVVTTALVIIPTAVAS